MKYISSLPRTLACSHIGLTVSVLAFLVCFASSVWASGGSGGGQGIYTPIIQEVTAIPTDTTLLVTATINPLSSISEAQIEYGLTTSYGGSQWTRAGVLEVPASGQTGEVGKYRMSFTITGLQPGQTYHYRIIANNIPYFGFVTGSNGVPQALGGIAVSLDEIATTTGNGPPGSFEAWRQLAFTPLELADAAISGPDATPQGSSLCNLVKFYFGYPPTAAIGDASINRANLPVLRLSSSENLIRSSLVFTRVPAVTDVSFSIETSTDAVMWEGITLPAVNISPATGFLETVEVPLVHKLTADYTKAFYRVKLVPNAP